MTERDTVRRGYDELQEGYAAVRSGDGRDVAILEEFLRPLPRSAQLLDAGCGPGSPVLRDVSAKATALGLDFSREQLGLASGNAPRASLVQGDMTALPLGDNLFDAVVAYYSLIHIPFEAHRTVIEEFSRVLRPGGRVLVTEGYTEWSGSNPDWLGNDVEMQWSIAGADATREQLRTTGFTITEEWEVQPSGDGGEHWMFFEARLDS